MTSRSRRVDVERVLVADRLRRVAVVDRVGVDAARPLDERRAVLAEPAHDDVRRQRREVADRPDAELGEGGAGLLADAPQPSDRQRREEGRLLAGRHDDQPVGLAQVRGDLGHELGRRDPDRGGQADLARGPRP